MGLQKLKDLSRRFKSELRLYRNLLADTRTPWPARVFLGLAVGYCLMPLDLIPDFIPVLGQLDDVILVPLFAYLAYRAIPTDLLALHRATLAAAETKSFSRSQSTGRI